MGYLKKTALMTASALTFCAAAPAGINAAAAPAGENRLVGATLTLTGEIGLNFYVDVSGGFDRFELEGPDGTRTVMLSDISPETEGEHDGLYKLTYPVDPTQLGESVTVRLLNGGSSAELYDNSGKLFSDDAEFSVKDYIELTRGNGSSSELEVLADTLDVYGAYSASWFGRADAPDFDDILPDITADSLSGYRFAKSGDLPEGVEIEGAVLLLDSNTTFRIYFNADPVEATIDGVSAKVGQKNGLYYIECPNISAPDLDRVHEAKVGGCTMKFSALSYVYSVLSERDHSDDLVTLVKALYAYNFAANIYFEWDSGNDEPTLDSSEFELKELGDRQYSFNYGGEEFSVGLYFPVGCDWQIVDSYKIGNRADMVIICEALLREQKISGCITRYRTARDMADEWEIHNRGYGYVKDLSYMASAANRLKNVDLDKKDQGKTFADFLKAFLEGG